MPSILVQLDDATFRALDRIAPPAKRKRTQFIREAVKTAIRKQEYAQMRQAYGKRPDAADEADNWEGCEKFEA